MKIIPPTYTLDPVLHVRESNFAAGRVFSCLSMASLSGAAYNAVAYIV